MIELDYQVVSREIDDARLASADEIEIQYDLFLGDIVFRVDDLDASAPWGWVPVVDFAVCLDAITSELVDRPDSAGSFEFTESTARIDFRRHEDTVAITTNYVNGMAEVPLGELRASAELFLSRVIDELGARHPGLLRNPAMRAKTARHARPRSLAAGVSGRSDTARQASEFRAIKRMDGRSGFLLLPPCTDAVVRDLESIPGFVGSPERDWMGLDPLDLPSLVVDAARAFACRITREAGEGPLPMGAARFLAIVENAVDDGFPTCIQLVEVDVFEGLETVDAASQRLVEGFGPQTAALYRSWLQKGSPELA